MSNNLWVGSLAADVSESELRNLFEKHGGVHSVTCYPSRNYAFIYLTNAEEAKRARDNLQGVVLHGNPLKIEFAKPAKPCKSLWISGISSSVLKEDLVEEFSKFGKIEDYKFQLDKNALYIDYFRLEDASKALKAMHGKYQGGALIRVDYSRSHSRRNILPLEGRKGDEEQPSNVLCVSYPPVIHIDEQALYNAMILFGEIEKIKSLPSRYCSFVEFRSMEEAQRAKNGLQGKLFNDPRMLITFSTIEPLQNPYVTGTRGPVPNALFNEIPFHGPGSNPINPISGFSWSHQSLSSPLGSMNQLTKSTPRTWDVFDGSQIQREPKRFKLDPQVNSRFTKGRPNIYQPDVDYIWRGIIAKGGTPVCRARCVPAGDWIGYEIPDIVNCSARTGLDTLAKHYKDAIGFDIVFFLPDSEEDFASYTEFLQYMGDRNRAGVVKFIDGTTLFLVPPSDFLKTVLKVSGPDRLYGVVLKFPNHLSNNTSGPTISQPQYIDNLQVNSNHQPVSLTPELVASLTSLVKVNSNGQQPSGQFIQSNTVNDSNLAVTRNSYAQDPYFNTTLSSSQNPQGVQFDYTQDLQTVNGSNVYESQSMNAPEQMQQVQSGLNGVNDQSDADKNERYQSTLQFAANLLLQIQKRSGTGMDGTH